MIVYTCKTHGPLEESQCYLRFKPHGKVIKTCRVCASERTHFYYKRRTEDIKKENEFEDKSFLAFMAVSNNLIKRGD